ncbi:hypothetical protein BV22DRAFT_348411 [Leucogyrophana mollusca]|uniref:Uncharacterized protein n=1 Tax=Leucogyrophana mollusca TaxID=85980 RepID=A0ACB8BLT2_9AGAM|nr:hypothetical protein BV22DRAFT_348411 [Leucogyrophana mollusca]
MSCCNLNTVPPHSNGGFLCAAACSLSASLSGNHPEITHSTLAITQCQRCRTFSPWPPHLSVVQIDIWERLLYPEPVVRGFRTTCALQREHDRSGL